MFIPLVHLALFLLSRVETISKLLYKIGTHTEDNWNIECANNWMDEFALSYKDITETFTTFLSRNETKVTDCPRCADDNIQAPVPDGYPGFCSNCGFVEGEPHEM